MTHKLRPVATQQQENITVDNVDIGISRSQEMEESCVAESCQLVQTVSANETTSLTSTWENQHLLMVTNGNGVEQQCQQIVERSSCDTSCNEMSLHKSDSKSDL
jgi:hypothetical protein